MAPWITYGLLLLCAGAFALGVWSGSDRGRKRFPRLARFGLALELLAFVAAYLVLRPGAGDDGSNDIAAAAAAGRPIFVDLYSNY